MTIYEELEEKYDDSNILPEFDREEGVALVDLAHLVLLIDQELSAEETAQLKERVFDLTLEEEAVPEILASGDLVEPRKIRELVASDEERGPFIEDRAAEIRSDAHRRAALRVLATLSYTEGLDEAEEGVCHEIGRAFGFDEDEIEDLLIEGAVDVWELGAGSGE